MEKSKLNNYLEVTTNIAVLLVALVVLGNFAWHYLKPKPQIQSGLQKGDVFPTLAGIDYGQADQTLIIAMASQCEYCTESVSFYKQLIEVQRGGNSATPILAIFPDRDDEAKQYLQQHELNLNVVGGVDFRTLRLAGTPATILVDREGKIIDFWIGKPSKEIEQEIIKSITPDTQSRL